MNKLLERQMAVPGQTDGLQMLFYSTAIFIDLERKSTIVHRYSSILNEQALGTTVQHALNLSQLFG